METHYVGEIALLPYDFTPVGFLPCQGQSLKKADYPDLFALLGNKFGGNSGAGTFALPDYRDSIPAVVEVGKLVRKGLAYCIATRGEVPREGRVSGLDRNLGAIELFSFDLKNWGDDWLPLDRRTANITDEALLLLLPNGIPDLKGSAPAGSRYAMALKGNFPSDSHSTPGDALKGEVRLFPYDFVPAEWRECDGTVLEMKKHATLFSLLRTTFGGGGRAFGLPDLHSSAPAGLKYCLSMEGGYPQRE